ncbi:MAG: response regulator [Actinobacteria bacterium]|nr:response regulator [Actinomycetota bacterium]
MSKNKTVVLVEDDPIVTASLSERLTEAGYSVAGFASADQALQELASLVPQVIITDVRLPGTDGIDFLKQLKHLDESVSVIVMTAYATVSDAVAAMKLGAADYLPKPICVDELLVKIERLFETRQLRADRDRLQKDAERRFRLGNVIGHSKRMQEIFDVAEVVKDLDTTVLIQGSTGTGKELLARAIHFQSVRRALPFVPVSCVALSPQLLESELFGHERGAFTGAYRRKVGRFEAAASGTLFLDDVDDIPLELQTKLLRVLQERKLLRVGGEVEIDVQCRIICACKTDLQQLVEAGRFRSDLFFRMNVVRIELPPLAKRKEDLPLLVEHFVNHYAARQGKKPPKVDPEALHYLVQHDWPGNIRELENVIEASVAFCSAGRLSVAHLPPEITHRPPAQELFSLNLPGQGRVDLSELTNAVQGQVIRWALRLADGSQIKAAKLLNLPRTTLQSKMRKLGLGD